MSINYTRGTIKKNEKQNYISSHVPRQRHISEYGKSDESGSISEESLFYNDGI